jgi:hypothetical protein
MKVYGEWRFNSTSLGLSTRWRWVVSFMPQLLFPCGNHSRVGGWVHPRASGRCGEEKNFALTGNWTPAIQPVASPYTDQAALALFSTMSRPALGPTQPSIQWVLGALSPKVKPPHCEADHSPPSSAEVKKCGAIPPLSHTSSWRDACFATDVNWKSHSMCCRPSISVGSIYGVVRGLAILLTFVSCP